MQIFPINPTNNSIVSSSQRRNKNISFQSTETALILMVAREGVNIVKNYRKQEVIRALSRGLSDMQYCGEDLARSVYSGIAKLPDSFYTIKDDSSFAGFFNNLDRPMGTASSMEELRTRALEYLFIFSDLLDDRSHYNMQIKKDFLNSILDNGHEISAAFCINFRNLNDYQYSSFKKEIINNCLYSPQYNSKRNNGSRISLVDSFSIDVSDVFSSLKPRSRENILAEQRFNNLFLIGSLDKTYYKDFVEENRTTINQTKQFVKQFLQRNCSSDEFGLFQFYNEKLSNL